MPTPMPIMAAISGEKFGTVKRWVRSSSRAMPTPSPASAVMIGQAHRHDGSEGEEHDEDGGGNADALARAGRRGGGGGDRVSAELDLEAFVRRALSGVDDFGDGRSGDVGRIGGELDLGEGDVPIARRRDLVRPGGRERAGHALDVGQRLEAGHDPVDGSLVGRAGDGRGRVEDDVSRVTRLRREFGLQDVLRLLRRGVPGREPVLEVGAHHLGDDRDADDGQDPQDQDAPAAVVTGPGQASQRRHGGLLGHMYGAHGRFHRKIHH